MISCSSCGHTLRDTARFCTACGTPVARAAEPLTGTVSAQADSATNVVWAAAAEPAPMAPGSVVDLRVAHDTEQQDGARTPAVVQLSGVYFAPHAESPAQAPADTAPIEAQAPVSAPASASEATFGVDTQVAAPGSRGAQPGAPMRPALPPARIVSQSAQPPVAPLAPAASPAPPAASPAPTPASPAPAPGSPYPPPLYPEPGAFVPRQYDAQALAAAAEQARVKVGACSGRIRLPQEQIVRALRDGALIALGAWAVGAALIALLDNFTPSNAAPMIWARSGAVILGMSVRASVALASGLSDSLDGLIPGVDLDDLLNLDDVDMSGSVTFMPLALTAALAVAVAITARRAARASASHTTRDRAVRALLTGLAFGALAAVLALALRGPMTPGGTEIIGANWLQVFLGGTVIAGLATFWGLGSHASQGARLPQLWQHDLRTGGEYVMATFVAAAAVIVGAIIVSAITAGGVGGSGGGVGDLGAREAVAAVLSGSYGIILMVPTMLVTLAGVLTGATFNVHAAYSADLADTLRGAGNESGTQRWGVLEGGVPGQYLLILLALTVIVLLFVGLRAAMRSSSAAAVRIWQPALISGVCWLVLAWLASLSFRGRVNSGEGLLSSVVGDSVAGTTTLGVSPLGAAIAAAVWTAVALILGRYAAPVVGRTSPTVLAALGGRRMDDTWKVLVADALLRRAKNTPKHLAPVADGLRNGSIPPPAQPLV